MKLVRPFVVAVLALALLASASLALADRRVALVVGNSTYSHIGRLPNADTDARDMSSAQRRLASEVTTELDAGWVALNEAPRAFTRRADLSPVFYAGHGIEMDGCQPPQRNISVDSPPDDPRNLVRRFSALTVTHSTPPETFDA